MNTSAPLMAARSHPWGRPPEHGSGRKQGERTGRGKRILIPMLSKETAGKLKGLPNFAKSMASLTAGLDESFAQLEDHCSIRLPAGKRA